LAAWGAKGVGLPISTCIPRTYVICIGIPHLASAYVHVYVYHMGKQ